MTTVTAVLLALLALFALLAFFVAQASKDHSAYDAPKTPPVMADADVSAELKDVEARLGAFNRNGSTDVHVARKRMEDLFFREVDAEIIDVDVDGIPGEWVLAEGANPANRLLYLHGGAFRVGSPRSHRHLTFELSKRAGVAVLAIDYRMQPEFKTRQCHQDARTAYQWILQNGPKGQDELKSLFVAGDSAGGNLTLSVIAWAKHQGQRPVDGAIAFAPATDSTLGSPTWRSNLDTDPFLGPAFRPLLKMPNFVIRLLMRLGTGAPLNDPMISPLLGDLSNLPPTLIQVSRDEMLYGDAQRYANKANATGGSVTLQVWPRMVHVFQGFPELPEASDALARAADFIKGKLGRNDAGLVT